MANAGRCRIFANIYLTGYWIPRHLPWDVRRRRNERNATTGNEMIFNTAKTTQHVVLDLKALLQGRENHRQLSRHHELDESLRGLSCR